MVFRFVKVGIMIRVHQFQKDLNSCLLEYMQNAVDIGPIYI